MFNKICSFYLTVILLNIFLLPCLQAAEQKKPWPYVDTNEILKQALIPAGMVEQSKLLQKREMPEVSFGSPSAPVKIIEYYSLTCPHCAEFHLNDLPIIERKYIATGKVQLIEREFPYDPRAFAASMIVRCAPKEQYSAMVNVLFSKYQNWVFAKDALPELEQIAKLSGFSHKKFMACLADETMLSKMKKDYEFAKNNYDVGALPTFFINGEKYIGRLTAAEMSNIIDNLVKVTKK